MEKHLNNLSMAARDARIQHRYQERRGDRHAGIRLFCLVALALLCAPLLLCGSFKTAAGVSLAGVFGMPMPSFFREEFEGKGGGGGGMSADEFQRKTLDAVAAIKKQQADIEAQISEHDKEGKRLSDEFAKAVKNFDGLGAQLVDVTKSLAALQRKIAQETTGVSGALARIQRDEEQKTLVNALFRARCGERGRNALNDEQKAVLKALAEASGTGSYTVNAQLLTNIYQLVAEYGVWAGFDVIPVSTSSAKMIVDTSDPVAGWVAENTAPSESSYNSSNVTATIGKILAWIGISNELIEDSDVDITAHVTTKFARAVGYRLDWSCLAADGTSDTTDGGYTGIFVGGTAAVAASANVSIATLDFEDVLATLLAVDASVLTKPGSSWWIHPAVLVQLLQIKDGNGRPIFLPSTSAPAAGGIGTLLGYPIRLAHAAPSTDGVSKVVGVFGDPMGLGVALRRDLEIATSDQAKFTEDETVVRARARGAVKVKAATAFGMLKTAAS